MKTLSWSNAPAMVVATKRPDGSYEAVDNARAVLEWSLRQRRVSEAIIERVMRLNPAPKPYEKPRGIHYKETGGFRLYTGLGGKGYVIRVYGREVWDRIPRSAYVKEGRRIFVHAGTVMDAMRDRGSAE